MHSTHTMPTPLVGNGHSVISLVRQLPAERQATMTRLTTGAGKLRAFGE